MRWNRKAAQRPETLDTRIRTPFAWRPTRVGDHVVWLERYCVREWYFQPASGGNGWWIETDRDVGEVMY